MNIPNMISGLQKSTKITVIACVCFLALVGLILLFLMMFPIDPQKYSAENPETTSQNASEETADATEDLQTASDSHPLSTWEADLDDETKPIDEQWSDAPSTQSPAYQDPVENPTQPVQPVVVTTTPPEEWHEPVSTAPEIVDPPENTDIPMASETIPAEVVTPTDAPTNPPVQETVPPAVPTEPEPPAVDSAADGAEAG